MSTHIKSIALLHTNTQASLWNNMHPIIFQLAQLLKRVEKARVVEKQKGTSRKMKDFLLFFFYRIDGKEPVRLVICIVSSLMKKIGFVCFSQQFKKLFFSVCKYSVPEYLLRIREQDRKRRREYIFLSLFSSYIICKSCACRKKKHVFQICHFFGKSGWHIVMFSYQFNKGEG